MFSSKFAKHRLYVEGKRFEFNHGLITLSDPEDIALIRKSPEFNKNIVELSTEEAREKAVEEAKGPEIVDSAPKKPEGKEKNKKSKK